MHPASSPRGQCAWLVDDFASRVPGVAHAVAISSAGLRIAASRRLAVAQADQVAAAASGVLSLTSGVARSWQAGSVVQTVITMDLGVMIAMPVDRHGACLAVLAAPTCDLGHVAFEMARLAPRLGQTPEMSAETGNWPVTPY